MASKVSSHNVMYIAHRGHGESENTADNFRNCTAYEAIECDVRLTADRVFIINHNEEVSFSDGSSLSVAQSTYEELSQKTLKVGGYICTFEEYLTICKEINKEAVIELKTELTDQQLENLFNEIDCNYSRDKISIISFVRENLVKIKAEYDVPVYLLFDNNLNSNIEFCVENNINVSAKYKLLSKKIVKKMHKNNLKVSCWTVNNKFANFKMKLIGVDYITSDVFHN